MDNNTTRVLLVEDNPGDARLFREILGEHESTGEFTVTHVSCLTEALAKAAEEYDAVMVDLGLPECQGKETLAKICAIFPQHPIIVLTGLNDNGMSREALRLGAQDYLVKGRFDHEMLLRSIRYAIERKRAEEKLQTAHRMLAEAQRIAHVGSWGADLSTGELSWSDEMYRIVGVSAEKFDLTTESFLRLIHPDDREIMVRWINSTRTGKKEQNVEFRILRPDGTLRYIRGSGEPIMDNTGSVVRAIGTAQDITDQKLAEVAGEKATDSLKKSLSLLSATLESTGDGILVIGKDGTITGFNQQFAELWNIPWGILAGRDDKKVLAFELSQLEDPDAFLTTVRHLQTHPEEDSLDELRFKDGRVFERYSRPQKVDGTPVGRVWSFRDVTRQKQAEAKLRESAAYHRNLTEASPDAMVIIDPDGIVMFASPKAAELFGVSADTLAAGQNMSNWIWPDDQGEALSRVHAVLSGEEKPIPREFRFRRQDGTQLWGEVNSSPILDHDGKVVGLLLVVRDITARKSAEQAVRESEMRFRSVWECSNEGMRLTDGEGRIVDVNEAYCSIVKMSREQLRGASFSVVYKGQGAGEGMEVYRDRFESGTIVPRMTARIKLWNNDEIDVEISNSFIDLPRGTKMLLSIFRDITAQEGAKEALRESEAKYRTLFEESKDCLYISTADGKLIDINPAGVEMFGYSSREEMLKIDVKRDLYADPEEHNRFIGVMKERGFVRDFELVLKKRTGEKVVTLETATTVRDANANPILFRGSIRDVTRQRLLEMQVAQSQKMESLGLLAGGIAHDFNNILGIILGHTGVVEHAGNDHTLLEKSTQEITNAVQRGASLVRQILTFARKADVAAQPISVNATINELVKMVGDTFPKTISMNVRLEKPLPIIMMDPGQLHQALLNLCVNARDAITEDSATKLGGGEINLSTRVVRGDEMRAKFPDATAQGYVCISITDTGKGMDEQTRMKIFEPFFTTKAPGKGTGLGLAVVYGIVKTAQGYIDVESEPGRGARFNLYFPHSEDAVIIPAPKETVSDKNLRGTETILLVEDEEILLGLMTSALKNHGYNVLTATDGIAAVKVFAQNHEEIALVLTDLGLPKMDGVAMFMSMKEIDPKAIIVLASGYLEPNLKSNLLRSGAKEFIQKPYKPLVVLKTIREILDNASGIL